MLGSDVMPVGAWWGLAAMAVVVHLGVYVPWMPTPGTRTQALLAPVVLAVMAAGFHVGEGHAVSGCLGAYVGAMLSMTLCVAGRQKDVARWAVAKEAGVPEADLPHIPASVPMRLILLAPLLTGAGLVLGG
ncbi:hypothetical protein ACIPPM_11010 [Streptomyces sp. NPDC090119]|uniref:hypothetical protein n=1 Tax=Streptomyces sp. NPDC090119 TaxID=3365951 RepID=UPI00382982C5